MNNFFLKREKSLQLIHLTTCSPDPTRRVVTAYPFLSRAVELFGLSSRDFFVSATASADEKVGFWSVTYGS